MQTIAREQGIDENVFPLEGRPQSLRCYDELLGASTEYLEETAEKLLETAIDLAASGRCASPEEEEQEVSDFAFDPATLLHCPDDRVRRITVIWQQIMDILWDAEVDSNP